MVRPEVAKEEEVIVLLKVLKDVPERDPRAVSRGRARFMAEIKALDPVASLSPFQHLNLWIANLPGLRISKGRPAMRTAILSILLAFAILLGGGAVTAYAAQDSLPNDALYPLKLFLEDARYSLTSNSVEQIELLTEFANNRTYEIFTLAADGEEVPEEVTIDLQRELQTMLILAAGLDEENLVSVLEQIRLNLQDQDSWEDPELGQAMTGVPEGVEPAVVLARFVLTEQHRIAEDGMEEPLKFQQNFGYRRGQESLEEPPEVTEPVGTPVITPEVTPGVDVTEESVQRPGNCDDPEDCKPEEIVNPDASQNGEDNGNNGNNGNNGGNSSYYIYIGGYLYLYNNGYYTYVGNGQHGGGNGHGNGGNGN